jgi:hypothetical protein
MQAFPATTRVSLSSTEDGAEFAANYSALFSPFIVSFKGTDCAAHWVPFQCTNILSDQSTRPFTLGSSIVATDRATYHKAYFTAFSPANIYTHPIPYSRSHFQAFTTALLSS